MDHRGRDVQVGCHDFEARRPAHECVRSARGLSDAFAPTVDAKPRRVQQRCMEVLRPGSELSKISGSKRQS